MSAKNVDMSKIKQVMNLLLQTDARGKRPSNREIGRITGLYKGTVNDYVRRIEADSLSIPELLALDDPVLERRLCPGSAAYSDPRFDELASRLDYLQSEMQRRRMTLQLLYEEYLQDVKAPYSYTQFCFHYRQHVKAHAMPSMVLNEFREGGKEVFVDFAGDKLQVTDPKTGEKRDVELFVTTLPASDCPFARAYESQRVDDLVDGMQRALAFYGGVPQIIVTDNLKSSVVKSDRYQPEPNRVFEDMCNHYGCALIPARSAKPKDKALVENAVNMIYNHVYAALRNRVFFSLEELNEAIDEYMERFRQRRMKDYKVTRQERFLAVDRPKLRPLPPLPFEIKCYGEYTVHHNGHIRIGQDGRWYSVPMSYIGKKVKVVYTPKTLSIYHHGECLYVHSRAGKQKYVTVASHMPSYYGDYQKRSPDGYIEQAMRHTAELGDVMRGLFASNTLAPPETFYKSADGLLSLARKTDRALFSRACRAALTYGRCAYSFIKGIVENKGAGLELPEDRAESAVAYHANIRGKEYYSEKYY